MRAVALSLLCFAALQTAHGSRLCSLALRGGSSGGAPKSVDSGRRATVAAVALVAALVVAVALGGEAEASGRVSASEALGESFGAGSGVGPGASRVCKGAALTPSA